MWHHHVYQEEEELRRGVGEFLLHTSTEALKQHNSFSLALSGGSLPQLLATYLCKEEVKKAVEWDKWHIFFVDERMVPHSHPESNYHAWNEHLFQHLPIPHKQIYKVDTSLSLQQAAENYQHCIAQALLPASPLSPSPPSFDLLLLGMGPDGHTASLFPGHSLLQENTKWIAALDDSPKAPPQRITFTYPLINAASTVAFVAAGEGKQHAVAQVLKHDSTSAETPLPAARVRPTKGSVTWFLDQSAAALL